MSDDKKQWELDFGPPQEKQTWGETSALTQDITWETTWLIQAIITDNQVTEKKLPKSGEFDVSYFVEESKFNDRFATLVIRLVNNNTDFTYKIDVGFFIDRLDKSYDDRVTGDRIVHIVHKTRDLRIHNTWMKYNKGYIGTWKLWDRFKVLRNVAIWLIESRVYNTNLK